MAMSRTLIRYAGWEPPSTIYHRKVPVERAAELRERGMCWKEVAHELTMEYRSEGTPFTADGVQAAVFRARKKGALT